MSKDIPIDQLKEFFSYDPVTGIVTRRYSYQRHFVGPGKVVGSPNRDGYLVVHFSGSLIRIHRLAWLLHFGEWPVGNIDHVNGVRIDNRIENLRIADYYQNQANTVARVNSKSGIKGVSPFRGRWQARIRVRGKQFHLGVFDCKEDAAKAYAEVAKANFGEFAGEGRAK